jgi:hypothetical protein
LNRVLKRIPNNEKGNWDLNTYDKYPEAEKLERAIRASSKIASYVVEMEKLSNSVQGKNIFNDKDYMNIGLEKGILPFMWSQYMSCKLAKVMGKDAFKP